MLGAGIPDFPVYLLSGLLAWNLFSASMTSGARSVLDNANLVKKVAFPREILPLSAVGVALVDFALQTVVLFLFLLVTGYGFHVPELALWPLAFVTLVVLTVALSLWFAAVNVRYRDVGHLLNIALIVWFWATPIVYAGYQAQLLADGGTGEWLGVPRFALYLLNPLADVVAGFQRALYGVGAARRRRDARPVRREPRVDGGRPRRDPGRLRRRPAAHVGVLLRPLGRLRGGAVVAAAIEVRDLSKRFRVFREKPTS